MKPTIQKRRDRGEKIQKREEIAWRLQAIWGRDVSPYSVSRFINSTVDPLPAEHCRRRILVYRRELEQWARRQIRPARAAVKTAPRKIVPKSRRAPLKKVRPRAAEVRRHHAA